MALLLCGGLLLTSLTGCGGTKTKKPGSVAGYDEGEEYISMWVHTIKETDEGAAYAAAVDAFNEHYNGAYFLDVEFVPRNDSGGGYSDKVNAAVMSGGLPDVLTVDGPNVSAYANNHIIQPLAELSQAERDEYLPSIVDQGTIDGELYALGAMESSVALYYNKDILDAAGVQVPDSEHPWTRTQFDDVLAQVRAVLPEDQYCIDMPFPVGESTIYYYAPFIWANGGDFVSGDGLTVDGVLNSDENVATLEYINSLITRDYVSKTPIDNLFETGRAAFLFDGAWEVNSVYTSYPDLDLGIAPYPVGDDWDGGRYTPTGSWAYAASADAGDIDAATEVVKWMSGTDSSVILSEKIKSMPSTYAAYDQLPMFQDDENYAYLQEQLINYGHPRPKTPVYPQVSTQFQQAIESVVLNGQSAKETLDKSVERIDAKLERYVRE